MPVAFGDSEAENEGDPEPVPWRWIRRFEHGVKNLYLLIKNDYVLCTMCKILQQVPFWHLL